MTNSGNEHLLLTPDIPEEYILDTDDIDSIYIAQRYLLQMLAHLRSGGSANITVYDTPELDQLLNLYRKQWLITESEHNRMQDNMLLIPPEHYTPTWYITGRTYDWGKYVDSRWGLLEYQSWSISKEVRLLLGSLGNFPGWIRIKWYKVTNAMMRFKELIEEINPNTQTVISDVNDSILAKELWWKSFLHDWYFTDGEKKAYWIPEGSFIKHSEWTLGLANAISGLKKKWIFSYACKPVLAASWEWIILLRSDSELSDFISGYTFPFWDIVLEELIDLASLSVVIPELWEDPLSLSVQFQDGKLMWQPTVQITHNWEFQGNIRMSRSTIKEKNLDNLTSIIYTRSERMIDRLWLTWSWWFDYLISKAGTPYFIDPNLWRDTWALPLRTFDKIFWSEEQNVMFVKLPAHWVKDLEEFQKYANEAWVQIFSADTNRGIIPTTFISERHLSVIIVADEITQLWSWYEKIQTKLQWLINQNSKSWRLIQTTQWKVLYTTLHAIN